MVVSEFTNSLNPNVSSEAAASFNKELPSSETGYEIQGGTGVPATATAYAGYNPNDDNDAPELGAVASPIGEAWTPLIVFVLLYVGRVYRKRIRPYWFQVSRYRISK